MQKATFPGRFFFASLLRSCHEKYDFFPLIKIYLFHSIQNKNPE